MDALLTKMLRDKGFKVTPQRLAIYNILVKTKEHPNAEMIFNQLQPHYPTMSLATVYKTVEILQEIGLVQILNVGEDSFRYDAITDDHAHIRCTQCNRIEDLCEMKADGLVEEAARASSYEITGQQFYFFGVCPLCQGKKPN